MLCSLLRRRALSLCAVLLAGVLPPAFAGSGLTLDAAQHIALGQSRKLAAQDAAITASQDRELSARIALAERAKGERDDALRAHVAETAAMLGDWQSGRERLVRYRGELIPLAAERTAATLAAYRGGKSALSEVLAARRNELDVKLQALQLDADTAKMWAQLNFMAASGQPTRDSQ